MFSVKGKIVKWRFWDIFDWLGLVVELNREPFILFDMLCTAWLVFWLTMLWIRGVMLAISNELFVVEFTVVF